MIFKKIFAFFSSIHFTIILMGSLALLAIVGTFLESKTNSHLFAANLTYHHPLFLLLLGGFFINILFSALRRWPFQKKHVPFLITHFGLLMVLAGVFVKTLFGLQGEMTLIEGTSKVHVSIPHSSALLVEKREPKLKTYTYPFKNGRFDRVSSPFKDLKIEPLFFQKNSEQKFETWVKGGHLSLLGYPLFKLHEGLPEKITPLCKVIGEEGILWEITGYREDNSDELMKRLFLEDLSCRLVDRRTGESVAYFPFKECLQGYHFSKGEIFGDFTINPPSLSFFFNDGKVLIPLSEKGALRNFEEDRFGSYPISISLEETPRIAFIQNSNNELYLFATSPLGEIYKEKIGSDLPPSLFIYESGFCGYTVPLKLPFSYESSEKKRKKLEDRLRVELKSLPTSQLSPPLQLFYESAEKAGYNFHDELVRFLVLWDEQNSWLYKKDERTPESLLAILENIAWDKNEKKGCMIGCELLFRLEEELMVLPLEEIIKKKPWNYFKKSEEKITKKKFFSSLTKELFLIGQELNFDKRFNSSPEALFSFYLRAFDTHFQELKFSPEKDENKILLETPLAIRLEPKPSLTKLEDNIPSLTFKISDSQGEEIVSLPYNKEGKGLKWPALRGRALLSFQPEEKDLGLNVRLRQARQIPNSNSNQIKSYECDLLIKNLKSGECEECTLSMNHVHETKEGYRFYLAGIHQSSPMSPKKVHLIINHDPAKTLLTYPGALLTCIGIFLLFWKRPYHKN